MFKAVRVIGIGDDGCLGLSSRAYNATVDCQVLVGGERQLAFFPDHPGRKVILKKNLKEVLKDVQELSAQYNVAVLASGDPLFYGIGSLVVRAVGAEHVDIIPAPSSIQQAFARIAKPSADAKIISVHGRTIEGLVTKLQKTPKAALFTDSENSPQRVAQLLSKFDDKDWQCWVCENLGSADERVRSFSIEDLTNCDDISPLNVMILERPKTWQAPASFPFHSEDDFAKRMPRKGLITKTEVRTLSLAKLQIRPKDVVWDIGTASGSVAIEAAKLCPEGYVHAVECDERSLAFCEENLVEHKVDNVRLCHGLAPEALKDLSDPDAIFIGGTKGSMLETLSYCFERLKPGGRLLVNAVTLDNVVSARNSFEQLGLLPDMVLLQVSRGVPLAGKYIKYEAMNPIHMFSITKQGADHDNG